MQIFILDGAEMVDRDTAYDYISETLRLPDYFGHNLDALADALSELTPDCIIILLNSFNLIDNLDKYGVKMIQVFQQAAAEEYSFTFIKK